MAQQIAKRQLYRSRDAYLAGVCAGIAEYCDFDAIVIRILAILLTLTTFGCAAIVYLILWAYLPRAPESPALYDITPEWAESSAFGEIDLLNETGIDARSSETGPSLFVRLGIAVALMLVFMAVAVNVTPLLSGSEWWQFWPLGLLMIGLCLIVIPVGSKHTTAWHAFGIVVMSVGASLLPMTLGVIAWETIPFAFERLWVFVVVALVLFILGFTRNSGALMVTSALCITAFCLLMLLLYAIPGDADAVLLLVSGDGVYRVGLINI